VTTLAAARERGPMNRGTIEGNDKGMCMSIKTTILITQEPQIQPPQPLLCIHCGALLGTAVGNKVTHPEHGIEYRTGRRQCACGHITFFREGRVMECRGPVVTTIEVTKETCCAKS